MTLNAAYSVGTLIGKRYILQHQLGFGGMGAVYRAFDRLAGQNVALKQVTTEPGRLRFGSFSSNLDLNVSLAQEFRTLASLRHPHIISVLDYGFNSLIVWPDAPAVRMPYFTMELLEHGDTLLASAQRQTLVGKVDLLLQLLHALLYLHRRGILHRDLKPSNVMVTTAEDGSPVVKTLDFGLSVAHHELDPQNYVTVGTLDYMSPEVLRGQPPTEAADLFAVGVMAYEVFAGSHPFKGPNNADFTAMLNNLFEHDPDISMLPPTLAPIVLRLLAKNPTERYRDAAIVIAELRAAVGISQAQENTAIRESFLQAARLIGRDGELTQLTSGLSAILYAENPAGSAWLVAGESGVGKSRLLDELRTQALVRGALVLRGQSVSAGGSLYGLWRPVLRWLCLTMPISAEEASVLKPLVPDLAQLLGLPDLPDAPELPPQAAQERLFATIEGLFARQTQPTLLILEDLHWASESLDLLVRITAHVKALPLQIVASFRYDERPDLPEKLPDMRLLRLKRLSAVQVRELSVAMLGNAGRLPQVVDLLTRETEGNALFIVEVVRTLAEEAGHLDRVGAVTLPQQIVAGGMYRIIQRKLLRLPDATRPLLELAATAGRVLDLPVLQAASGIPDLADWLTTCANAAVLEVQENRWRFSHDKLRDGVLAEIPDERRPQRHAQLAHAIEAVHAHSSDQTVALAYHWQQAGDAAKSAYYAEQAADQAITNGANRVAVQYLEQALQALQQLPPDPAIQRRIVHITMKYTRAGAHHALEDGERLLQEAAELARGLHDEELEARVLGSSGAFFFMRGQMGKAFGFFNQSIAAAERFGLDEMLVLPYNILGRAMALNGDYGQSNEMLAKGIPLAERFGENELLSGSLAFYGVGLVIAGQLEAGEPVVARCLALSASLGLPERHAGDLVILGMGYLFAGQFDRAQQFLSDALHAAQERHMPQSVYVAGGGLGVLHTILGHTDEALKNLSMALKLFEEHRWMIHASLYLAYQAELNRRMGDPIGAQDTLQKAAEVAQNLNQKLGGAEIARVRARLAIDNEDWEAAETHLRACMESHEAGSRVALAVRAKHELGEVLLRRGLTEEANRCLSEAQQSMAALHMSR